MKCALTIYILSEARKKYSDSIDIQKQGRMTEVERNALYKQIFSEWETNKKLLKEEIIYAFKHLREYWIFAALGKMCNEGKKTVSLEKLHQALEEDIFKEHFDLRSFLQPFKNDSRDEKRPKIPMWTDEAEEEFKTVMCLKFDWKDFYLRLRNA